MHTSSRMERFSKFTLKRLEVFIAMPQSLFNSRILLRMGLLWQLSPVTNEKEEQVIKLLKEGMKQIDVAGL